VICRNSQIVNLGKADLLRTSIRADLNNDEHESIDCALRPRIAVSVGQWRVSAGKVACPGEWHVPP